jgi:hypothetical protein
MSAKIKSLVCYIDGIGLLGPGLDNWTAGRAILAGLAPRPDQKTVLPSPAALPPAERRRCGPLVKLSLAVGLEAATAAEQDVKLLPTVFSSSSGDGENCHAICEMLASDDRQISPTRFHNSVHNAASGYWSIATGAMAPSSPLCAHDASFGAGLLEAAAQAVVDDTSVLLIACDTTYPKPLQSVRPITADFAVGLVLSPRRGVRSLARIAIAVSADAGNRLSDSALEQIRAGVPAARALPLLQAIAKGESGACVLDYLDNSGLRVEIESCS